MPKRISNSRILVTGGAGFIGSNLVGALLEQENEIVVLDNFATGKLENLLEYIGNKHFQLMVGDIRNLEDCRRAVDGVEYVFHEAALGSVPRSVKDPMTTTAVNILGFVNMLFVASQAKIKRFVYAASSSTYGDSQTLPKVEAKIGKPLSPYAITKYANELYADNFHQLYGIDTVGLRYFNVFGRRQDPFGAYAAVIPKFVLSLTKHESPVINGDGSFSRDFTYVDNVIQANLLAALADNPEALNEVYNVAFGERITLNELFVSLRDNLSQFDPSIAQVEPVYGPERAGDIPHSLASIDKAKRLLGYDPKYSVKDGLRLASKWYFNSLKP